jgi:hypothetical protein
MNFNNFASMSYGKIMPNFKKTFFINELKKPNIIPDFEQKTITLFEEPENYLKLPNETEFNIVVGRKPKGPRFNSEHKLVPYSIVGSILRKGQKKFTKKKSILNKNIINKNSLLPSRSSKKNCRFSKLIRYNPVLSLDAVTQKDDKKKKKDNFTQLTRIELFDIFNKSKKRIRLNKNKNLHKNNSLCKEIPKIMQQYITEPLSQQERSLKTIEKYNNLINKIENNFNILIDNFIENKKEMMNKIRNDTIDLKNICINGLDEIKDQINLEDMMIDEKTFLIFHQKLIEIKKEKEKIKNENNKILNKYNNLSSEIN